MVLLQDNSPRLQWPLGLVEEVFPGRDGVIRTVQVRAKSDSFVRSVEKLHMLELQRTETVANDNFSVNAEVFAKSRAKDSKNSKDSQTKDSGTQNVPVTNVPVTQPVVTRSGRNIKPVERFGL